MRIPRGVVKDKDRIIDRKTINPETGEPVLMIAKDIPAFLANKAQEDKLAAQKLAEEFAQNLENYKQEAETAKSELEKIKSKLGLLGLDLDNLPDKLPTAKPFNKPLAQP